MRNCERLSCSNQQQLVLPVQTERLERLYESIKFSFWQDEERHHHVWQAGWGPCGRWVSALGMTISDGLVTIEQRSYSSDMTAVFGELKTLAASRGVGHSNEGWVVKIRNDIEHLNQIVKDRRKVETFVYQLCDIVGPIKRVHLKGRE